MDILSQVLGLGREPKDLGVWEVCLRAILVFLTAVVIGRLADKRFLAKLTAFDAILGFVLGSMLARAINGSAPLFPTLAAGFVLVGLHRLFLWLAFRLPRFDNLIKGEGDILIKNGRPNNKALRANNISEKDLLEELRLNGQVTEVEEVRTATLERSGEISVVPAKK